MDADDEPLKSHNDDPVDRDDFLGRAALVREVAATIRDCRPPKGIGITGYWGAGKTSFLKQLRQKLAEEEDELDLDGTRVRTVWFEAWRYQREAQPVIGLLHEIRANLSNWHKAIGEMKKLSEITLRGALSAFDEVIKAATGGVIKPKASSIEAFADRWEESRRETPLPTEELRRLLEEAIEAALGERGRLVILIDDLDRCEGASIVRLLEGIKLYLSLSRCVVVFALDQRQIESALSGERRTESTDVDTEYRSRDRAREYLEKLCQDIFRLPLPKPVQKSQMLIELIRRLDHLDQGKHKLARDACLPRLASILELFDCLPANPRKIKVLANHLAVRFRRAACSEQPVTVTHGGTTHTLDRAALLLLTVSVLYCYHRPVYEQLEKDPAYFNQLSTWSSVSKKIEDLRKDPAYAPMRDVLPSRSEQGELPVNPSDSHVFRLHGVLDALGTVLVNELQPLFQSA